MANDDAAQQSGRGGRGGTNPARFSLGTEGADNVPKVESALQKLSQSKPASMVEMMAVMGGGMMNPLHNKMDAAHITKVLDLASQHDDREFQLAQSKETNATNERKSIRQYVFWGFVLVLILLAAVMVLFKDRPEVLLPVISGLTGLGAGFLAGFGAGKSQGK